MLLKTVDINVTVVTKPFDIEAFKEEHQKLLEDASAYQKVKDVLAVEVPAFFSPMPDDVKSKTPPPGSAGTVSPKLTPRNRKRRALESNTNHMKRKVMQRRSKPQIKYKSSQSSQETNVDDWFTENKPAVKKETMIEVDGPSTSAKINHESFSKLKKVDATIGTTPIKSEPVQEIPPKEGGFFSSSDEDEEEPERSSEKVEIIPHNPALVQEIVDSPTEAITKIETLVSEVEYEIPENGLSELDEIKAILKRTTAITKKLIEKHEVNNTITLRIYVLDTETINPEAAKIEPKIVGGSAISIDQIPYQVSIRLTANDKKSYGSGHLCGGVVISQRLVATAAHCCYNTKTNLYRTAGEYVLVMGSSYLRSSTNLTLEYYLQQLIAHENYDATSLTNDIALMFINGYIPWGWPTVKALALSSQVVATGTECLISGWGLLQQSATSSSNSLQAATVPIISQSTCQISYGPIPSSQVCAGFWTGGTDACQGDSGGPLRCNGQLAGLVSYGSGCAVAGFPGVYTNVSFYHGWIVQQNNSLNYSIYHSGGIRLGSRWSLLGCLALILAFILDHRIWL